MSIQYKHSCQAYYTATPTNPPKQNIAGSIFSPPPEQTLEFGYFLTDLWRGKLAAKELLTDHRSQLICYPNEEGEDSTIGADGELQEAVLLHMIRGYGFLENNDQVY